MQQSGCLCVILVWTKNWAKQKPLSIRAGKSTWKTLTKSDFRENRERQFRKFSRTISDLFTVFSLPLDVPINRPRIRAIDFTSLNAASVLFVCYHQPSSFSFIDWSVVNGHGKVFRKDKKWFFQNPTVWCEKASVVATTECRVNFKLGKSLKRSANVEICCKVFFSEWKTSNRFEIQLEDHKSKLRR